MKSLFGPYNFFIDEAGHVLISLLIVLPFWDTFSLTHLAICLLFGLGLDIDHVFNTFICKTILNVPNYRGTLVRGDQGYSPHLFHGFDVVLVVGVVLSISSSPMLGLAVGLEIVGHVIWDFIVYPNKVSQLFLLSRAYRKFRVGKRNYLVGVIFNPSSLTY